RLYFFYQGKGQRARSKDQSPSAQYAAFKDGIEKRSQRQKRNRNDQENKKTVPGVLKKSGFLEKNIANNQRKQGKKHAFGKPIKIIRKAWDNPEIVKIGVVKCGRAKERKKDRTSQNSGIVPVYPLDPE